MRICAVRALLLAGAFLLWAGPQSGQGGTIRHDREDSLYTGLAASPEYQSVGIVRTSPDATVVSGTLVGPQWVLTAAHNVSVPHPTNSTFELGGTQYSADKWIVHPLWFGELGRGVDLALMRLQSPVLGVTPAPIYTGTTEFGQTAVIVGYGLTGNGLTGTVPDSAGTKRAGENIIDGLGSAIGASDNYALSDFDSPFGATSFFGDRFPLDLEYHTAIGDSGGGVFLDVGGEKQLAGVPSFIAYADDIPNASYGEIDGYMRVSLYADWIAEEITPVPMWNVDADGAWPLPSNWTGTVPNSVGARSIFGSVITAPHTVTVDAPTTLASIEFDNTHAYTLSGAGALTLDSTTSDVQLTVTTGSHVMDMAITAADDATINVVPEASNLLLSGGLSAEGQTVTKAGAGTLAATQIRAQSLSIEEGTVSLVPDSGTGATVIGSLSVAGPANVPTARIDVNNGALVIDYSENSPAGTVRQRILAGRGMVGLGAVWNGMGITSAAAAVANATEPESRSVGFAENATMPLGPLATFHGQAVDGTSILIAFTRTADANLDGVVNDDDVTIVGANYAPGVPQPLWAMGDFDFNGYVDDDDVTLLGALYDPAATPLETAAVAPGDAPWPDLPPVAASAAMTAVPEPGTHLLAIVSALTATLLGRHRRRGREARTAYSAKIGAVH